MHDLSDDRCQENGSFTALLTHGTAEVMPPHARVLDEHSYKEILENKTILFTGSSR